jgi:hypothetical protein
MQAEQKELYIYTTDHYAKDLNKINPECISLIIAVRQTVKKAIESYIKNYCTDDPFTTEDFKTVSQKIRDEIMDGMKY